MSKTSFEFHISKIAAIGFILVLAMGCNSIPEKPWLEAIPQYVPAIVIPEQDANISAVMRSEYMPFFEDISTSSMATISQIENVPEISILLKGMAIFPTQAEKWKPLWIAEADRRMLSVIAPYFEKDYAVNSYGFSGAKVHILHLETQTLYATQLNEWVLFSESSYAIEEALRSYLNGTPSIDIEPSALRPGTLVLNAPYFDRWLAQSGTPRHRPKIRDVFKGTKASVLQFRAIEDDGADNISITGTFPLEGEKTNLIQSVSHANAATDLDRFIPSDAASFAIFNHQPELYPPKDLPAATRLDSLLLSDASIYKEIAEALHPSFAYVAFQASGFLSVGENLYIRQLSDQQALSEVLQRLAREGYISRGNDVYTIESAILADMLGNSLSGYDYFTLSITHNSAVFSQRPGLTSRIRTDRSRRSVIYYDDQYTAIRSAFPDQVSGFFYARSKEYLSYLQPVLSSTNFASVVSSRFDIAAFSLSLDESGNRLDLKLQTFRTEESDQPYRERWVHPLDNTELTGSPILANLGSGNGNDILFATEDSRVFALAPDGTSIFQTNTGTDTPLGQPIIYDWYGNNQKSIFIAAGNKIYAWNRRGVPLPNFPIAMDEQISAPIQVADVSRNGRAELIVATADRKLHVLDGRGQNIGGWPQSTNSRIGSQPVFKEVQGVRSVWAYAENGLFAWNRNGRLRDGYPVFIDSAFKGEPLFYKDNVIAAAADGHLYSIGDTRVFADSLTRQSPIETVALEEGGQGSNVQSIYVSNSALVSTPIIETVRMHTEETGNIREEMIIIQNAGGSIFFFNTDGRLRMTQSMGQPADENFKLVLKDINNSGSPEITALASFGRLFTWNTRTGERYQELPTSAMKYPIFADINGDGRTEIIAKTREGIRCWTIMR